MSDVVQHDAARIMREALLKIANFPYEKTNWDLTMSQAVGQMAEIAQDALSRTR